MTLGACSSTPEPQPMMGGYNPPDPNEAPWTPMPQPARINLQDYVALQRLTMEQFNNADQQTQQWVQGVNNINRNAPNPFTPYVNKIKSVDWKKIGR